MRRSKHFRKDVMIARAIFALLCALIIAIVVFFVSLFVNPEENQSDKGKDTQQETQNQEDTENDVSIDTQEDSQEDTEDNTEDDAEEIVYYVKPVTEVRFRTEPNTGSITISKLPAGTKTKLIEKLEGWYFVEYEGQTGYISADYSEIVEGTNQ